MLSLLKIVKSIDFFWFTKHLRANVYIWPVTISWKYSSVQNKHFNFHVLVPWHTEKEKNHVGLTADFWTILSISVFNTENENNRIKPS